MFTKEALHILSHIRDLVEPAIAPPAPLGGAGGVVQEGGARHQCFWHMSDWAPGGEGGGGEGGGQGRDTVFRRQLQDLAPHLDVVCLPVLLAASAPPHTRIRWGVDVNTQLRGVLRAFNPAFYARHTFFPGNILPGVCSLHFPTLCAGPRNIRGFSASSDSALGRPLTAHELAAAAAMRKALATMQFPPRQECSRRELLIYCYTNPRLAGICTVCMHTYT